MDDGELRLYAPGVEAALRASLEAHAGQRRKGEPTPYVSHPVHVAMILARAGADAETLQAALLHDVVEDCEGWTLERLEAGFGPVVAEIVADLTEVKGGTWEVRKGAALEQVAHMGPRSLAVKTADKLHNVQSLLTRLRAETDPAQAWAVFSRGPGPTIEYAQRLTLALTERLAEVGQFEALGAELHGAVTSLSQFLPAR